MSKHREHPAVVLGQWLKQRRQQASLVARVFAGQIELSPAQYAEAEAGVVRWIDADQEELIPSVLTLNSGDRKTFERKLTRARAAKPLEFADLFEEAQLEPVRLRREGRKRLTVQDKQDIVEAVFTPLA